MRPIIASSPFARRTFSTSQLMALVIACLIPGMIVQWYVYGWGNIIQVLLASIVALATEAAVMRVRRKPIRFTLKDNSALLTAVLIGISLPPLTPWWITAIGVVFAILVAKQLYGGLGQNIFNPAMVAYVLLLISFPVQMTSWLPPTQFLNLELGLLDSLNTIFTGYSLDGYSVNQIRSTVDGVTMATPLDTLKTDLSQGLTSSESMTKPVFGAFAGVGSEWINLAFLVGGLILVKKRALAWHIPASFLGTLFIISSIFYLVSPDGVASPMIHLFSGASIFAAFFILTDPVTASTTVKGRIIFGALIAILTYCIRTWGGYPDAVAFAVLLANMTVPLIDYYTQPHPYGRKPQ
ncbi:electron transport complex subunit RsxD [Motilimonas pumila]|uniref:Ion-translocating oxidoreductase complex subunit D n=1 Tax=Motilimonas pumila TaxID=2303987 RepID=A0A418YFS0_9GAMM|nr:electron transport complex subunit RsxD [Motilimonas pumila]RJG48104.1 electron transport complex subunit RsxD [Motilimonas pumila]